MSPAHNHQSPSLGEPLTQEQMVGRGAYGFLSSARECMIPLEKVIPLLPDPVCEEWGAYRHGGEDQPIEVQYSREEDGYLLYAGNLRLREAVERGEQTIRAFVEADCGEVGPIVRLSSAKGH